MVELVSVIIPTYNRENIIKDAIETVLNQTYQEFEIIIVDDGSTDNTKEVVQKYNDDRIKYIYQPNSGKPSIARNTGIKAAKGDFIAFLDSDDLWNQEMLERHVKILNANKNIGFTTSWNSSVLFDGTKLYNRTCYADNSEAYINYLLLEPDKAYTGPSSALVKKECLDSVGVFDSEMDFCEDWDLFYRLAVRYEMVNIKEILTSVRVHKESFTQNSEFSKFRNSYLKFLEKSFQNEKLPTKMQKLKNKAYSNVYYCFGGMLLYDRKSPNASRKDYLKSLSYFHGKMFNIKFLIAIFLAFSPQFMLEGYLLIKRFYRKFLGKNY